MPEPATHLDALEQLIKQQNNLLPRQAREALKNLCPPDTRRAEGWNGYVIGRFPVPAGRGRHVALREILPVFKPQMPETRSSYSVSVWLEHHYLGDLVASEPDQNTFR